MTTWGLSSTILAPAPEILRFAAYHLEQGAHRLYLYLDAETPDAYGPLKAHPKIRVTTCDTAHWRRVIGKRPAKHQSRQSLNATHAYRRRTEVDWLIHMDVDEFLVPHMPISDALGRLGADTRIARVRPMEQLGGGDTAYKAFIPADGNRPERVRRIYPTFGMHLKGGFLSHIAGKIFVRTGIDAVTIHIHNAFAGEEMVGPGTELVQVDLAHRHAKSWADWRAAFDYRLDKGSYRSELKSATPSHAGGMSLHALFHWLIEDQGEDGLRAFYDEVIGDSADLRARLRTHGLLRSADLDLDAALAKHFPDVAV